MAPYRRSLTLDGTPLKRFDKAWRRTCALAGFNNLHFHDLRHTFCSNLILAGSDLKAVKEMIGHSDIAMTDRYSHLTLTHKRLLQGMLAEHYSNNREKSGTHMVHKAENHEKSGLAILLNRLNH